MNEQEKEFMAFVEWLPKNIEKFANVKPEDIISYLEELGKTPEGQNELKTLISKYKQGKNQINLNRQGGKINYLVNKFAKGGSIDEPIQVHKTWENTPQALSFMAAYLTGKSKDLPMRKGTTVRRSFARIQRPDGTIVDRIHREDGNGNTYRYISPQRDTTYEYNGEIFIPGDEMYDRYDSAWRQYDVYKDGGTIQKFQNSGKIHLYDVGERKTKDNQSITYHIDSDDNKYIIVDGRYGYGIIGQDTIPYTFRPAGPFETEASRVYKPTHARAIIDDVNKKDSLYGEDPNLGKTHFGYNKWGNMVFLPNQEHVYDEWSELYDDGSAISRTQEIKSVDGKEMVGRHMWPGTNHWWYYGNNISEFDYPYVRDSLKQEFYKRLNNPNTYSTKLHSK